MDGWSVARNQHAAVAAITNAGGSVSYDWQFKNGKHLPGVKPPAPAWLVNLIGVDYFGHVAAVVFTPSSNPNVSVFAHLSRLTQIEDLFASTPSVTDEHLAHLEGMTRLNVLVLDNTQVSDAGLVRLKGLTTLSYLSLSNTQVTDRGLRNLNGLSLWSLYLNGTRVTDAGLADLSWMQPQGSFAQRDTGHGRRAGAIDGAARLEGTLFGRHESHRPRVGPD